MSRVPSSEWLSVQKKRRQTWRLPASRETHSAQELYRSAEASQASGGGGAPLVCSVLQRDLKLGYPGEEGPCGLGGRKSAGTGMGLSFFAMSELLARPPRR